jgi:hypothetical protein
LVDPATNLIAEPNQNRITHQSANCYYRKHLKEAWDNLNLSAICPKDETKCNCEAYIERLGNDYLPALPILTEMLHSDTLQGALTSLLGE